MKEKENKVIYAFILVSELVHGYVILLTMFLSPWDENCKEMDQKANMDASLFEIDQKPDMDQVASSQIDQKADMDSVASSQIDQKAEMASLFEIDQKADMAVASS